MIRLDASARTTVIVCDCGWRELITGATATNRDRAWAIAHAHELREHSDTWQASNVVATRKTRSARM